MVDAQARTNTLWSQIKRGSRTFAVLSDGEPEDMRQIKSGALIQLWNKDRTKYIIKKIASVERCTINGDIAYIAWLEKGEADGISDERQIGKQ